jgi:PAS domain S-box-containing protein
VNSADRNPPTAERTLAPMDIAKGDFKALEALSAGPELNFQLDDITLLACALCQAPVALVCSRDQQGWRLSHNFGAEHEPLSFDLAFYTFAVTQRRAFEISDLRGDPSFSGSPLVTGAPHFRLFAGTPVTSDDGQLLGAICILDTKPRALTAAQRQGMEALARQVRAHLVYQQTTISQRHEQSMAREQQRQWQRVFECASLGMAEVSPEGEWSQVNGTFCSILGYTVNEMMQTRPRDLVHPDDIPSSVALLRKTLAGEIPSCSGEKRFLHKTGRIVWCSVHVTLVRNAAGDPAHFLAQMIDISEMRQAQEGWRNAELKAQAVLELPSPVGILTTDDQGGITFVNRFAEQLCGYAAEELVGHKSIVSLFLEAELREHSQNLARFFGGITHGADTILEHARVTGPETREWTWLRKDGSAVRVGVTVTAVKNARGEISGFAIAATPAAKAIEAASGTVDGRFRTIADSAPLGMFLTDAHGSCTYVNEMFHHITGMGTAEATGQGWYGIFGQADRNAFYNEFQKALRRGSDFCMEARLARQGAAWVRVRGREIFFDDVAQGFVCTLEDIDATRALFEKLKNGEERLRTLVTNAPFPIALLDRERKCVMASVGWLELHHRSWHEVNSQNIFEFIPEARERLEDLCRRALNGASQLVHEQNIKIQDEGHSEWLRWQLFPWRSGGEICGIGVFEERLTHHMRLIADADAAREAAEAASRVKSEFLAEVSSELRTPGSGIIGLVDMLLEGETNPQRREYLEMIKTSTGSWLKLAGEIYDFSKMEARKLELEVLPFNLMDGLNQTLRRLTIAAENKGVELVSQTSPDMPTVVVGDGGRLFQIVTHMVMFAIEMTDKGEIGVAVDLGERADNNPSLPGALEFHFVVRDTSGWLTDQKLEDIQQVLMMVENSPALKKVGTSLGLVLSARLANLMSGKLWVVREEEGAAFHLTVPLSGKRTPPAESPTLRGAAVLVADDSITHRRWLQDLLTAWGMKPTILEKPGAIMDVLEIAHEAGRPFKFVLLDAHIPDRDTFAFAAQIKAHPHTAEVKPIMLLSPSLRVADESRARELGIEHALVKPVNANDLHALMERALGGVPGEPVQPGKKIRNVLPRPRWDVLLVDDSGFNQEVAMGVFGQQGHRVTIARNGKEAAAILERRACDMVLVGLDTVAADSLETLAAIRQQEKNRSRPVKVFVMTANRTTAEREPALKGITDGFLPNPIQPKDLTLLLEQVQPELEQH